AGEPPEVAPPLHRRAAAVEVGDPVVAAGAGVRGEDELETRGEGRAHRRALDRDGPGLERLAERVEGAASELRGLVEMEHAAIRSGDGAGPDPATAAADDRGGRGGVMGRLEGRPRREREHRISSD